MLADELDAAEQLLGSSQCALSAATESNALSRHGDLFVYGRFSCSGAHCAGHATVAGRQGVAIAAGTEHGCGSELLRCRHGRPELHAATQKSQLSGGSAQPGPEHVRGRGGEHWRGWRRRRRGRWQRRWRHETESVPPVRQDLCPSQHTEDAPAHAFGRAALSLPGLQQELLTGRQSDGPRTHTYGTEAVPLSHL